MDEMIEQVNPTHVTLDDLEELMNSLSPEEVEELAECDPDDNAIPPSMRCMYKCNKQATGEIDRNHLFNGLKDIALSIPDKEEKVKFELGTKRGKVFVSNVEAVAKNDSGEESDEEDDEIAARMQNQEKAAAAQEFISALEQASENDIQDFAEILGLTFQDHCTMTPLKVFAAEAPNDTNVDEVIKKASENDADLMDINLNNIKHITPGKWEALFNALKENSTVESLSAANCDITDTIAQLLCGCIQTNSTIRSLNLESNSVSGEKVLDIIQASGNTKGLEELKITHQFNNKYLGASIEYALAEMIPKFPHLVKLGVALEFRDTLNKVAVALAKNLDKRRQNEDRTFTLKLDKSGKTGPKIVQEK